VTPLDLLWLFLIFSSLQPLIQQRILAARRTHALRTLERRRGSRAITLIHRRESCRSTESRSEPSSTLRTLKQSSGPSK
jgi:hypothetical protein